MQSEVTVKSTTVEQLAQFIARKAPIVILDVRRAPAFEKNRVLIPGALRLPPEEVPEWALRSSSAQSIPVVIYCVHGHEVSQGAAKTLQASGFTATFLAGGISEWQEQGRGNQDKNA